MSSTESEETKSEKKEDEKRLEKFMGKKERRRSSLNKPLQGDYMGAKTNNKILSIIGKHEEKEVLFADSVIKINRKCKRQERILLLTEKALYNIDPVSIKSKRRIGLLDISCVKMSGLQDNFFVICVPTEYDYLFVSSKKIEICLQLRRQYQFVHHGQVLPIEFKNTLEYKVDSGSFRDIKFTSEEDGVSTQIFEKKKS